MHEIYGVVYLLLPLVGGAVVHGAAWRYGWCSVLARPIDGGHTFRGKPVFGRNKTWRGPVMVAFGAAIVLELQERVLHGIPRLAAIELFDYGTVNGWVLGALVGAAAEFAELPNSFVKRQLGVPPGGTTRGGRSVVFYLWDQIDLLMGAWLVFASVVPVTVWRVVLSLIIALALHPLLTAIGYLLGMRATAR